MWDERNARFFEGKSSEEVVVIAFHYANLWASNSKKEFRCILHHESLDWVLRFALIRACLVYFCCIMCSIFMF